MNFSDMSAMCTTRSLMRVMRESSETRRYHLEKERQAMLQDTSFRDVLHRSIEEISEKTKLSIETAVNLQQQ